MPNPLIDVLVKTTVAHIRQPTPVRVLKTSDSVAELMRALHDYKVLSFPVMDDDGECQGVVDGVDLVSYLQQSSKPDLQNTTVAQLIDISQANPYIPVYSNTTLHGLITVLAPGCHRAVVFRSVDSSEVHSIFSESDLIRFLYKLLRAAAQPNAPVSKAVRSLLALPVSAFASIRSRPSNVVFADEPLSAAFAHVLEIRKQAAVKANASTTSSSSSSSVKRAASTASSASSASTSTTSSASHSLLLSSSPTLSPSTASGPQQEEQYMRAPLVMVLDRVSNRLVGHIGASELRHLNSETVNAFQEASSKLNGDNDAKNTGSSGEGKEKGGCGEISGTRQCVPTLQLTTKDYLEKFSPTSLKPVIVLETVTMLQLLKVLVTRHLHSVWVLPLDHSSSSSSSSTPSDVEVDEDGLITSSTHDVDHSRLEMLTLTDVLRWVARDFLVLRKGKHQGEFV